MPYNGTLDISELQRELNIGTLNLKEMEKAVLSLTKNFDGCRQNLQKFAGVIRQMSAGTAESNNATSLNTEALLLNTAVMIGTTAAAKGLSLAMFALPLALIAGAVAAVSGNFNKAAKEANFFKERLDESRLKMDELKRSVDDADITLRDSLKTLEINAGMQRQLVSEMDKTLKVGLGKEELDRRMIGLVEHYNAIQGETVIGWDKEKASLIDVNSKLETNTQLLQDNIDKRLDALKKEMYFDRYKKAFEQMGEEEAQKRFLLHQQEANDLVSKFNVNYMTVGSARYESLYKEDLLKILELSKLQDEAYESNRKNVMAMRKALCQTYGEAVTSSGKLMSQLEGEELLLANLEGSWGLTSDQIRAFANTANLSIEDVVKGVNSGAFTIGDVFANKIPVACQGAADAYNFLSGSGSELLGILAQETGLTTDEILQYFSGLSGGLITTTDTTWNDMLGKTQTGGDEVVGDVQETISEIPTVIAEATPAIGTATEDATVSMKTPIKGTAAIVPTYMYDMMTGAITEIGKWIGPLGAQTQSAADGATAPFSDFMSRGINFGVNLMLGLIHGLSSLMRNVLNFASSIARNILNCFSGIRGFDEGSPSKKTFMSGKNVMLGLINGMDAYKNSLYKSADDISLGVLDRLSLSPSAISDSLKDITTAFSQNPLKFYGNQITPYTANGASQDARMGNTYNISVNGINVESDSDIGGLCVTLSEKLLRKKRMGVYE